MTVFWLRSWDIGTNGSNSVISKSFLDKIPLSVCVAYKLICIISEMNLVYFSYDGVCLDLVVHIHLIVQCLFEHIKISL